jgi:hypothetical protein
MLAIDRHNASMSHLQIRIERHGDDRKLAADIKLSMNVHGTVLDDLERGLHESLFRKPGSGVRIGATKALAFLARTLTREQAGG